MTNILIVNDMATMRRLIKDALSREGYTNLWMAADAREALRLAKEVDFQIVLMDMVMPGMSGTELLKSLKEISPQTSVIVITASPSAKSMSEAVKFGVYYYITTPFNEEEIRLAVRHAEERLSLLSQVGQKDLLREEAILDYLTGVYNHRHFHEALSQEIEKAKRHSLPLSLAMVDVDNFKNYNDTYGHLAGDRFLRDLAQYLLEMTRSDDKVFRYGGEEFTILLPQTFKPEAAKLIEQILGQEREKFPLTLSVGLAAFPEDAKVKDELIEASDRALYQAKRSGRNRLWVWSSEGKKGALF